MKPKLIPVLEDCIEVGIKRGYNRAHKHNLEPTEEEIFSNQLNAVMDEIYERMEFEEKQ